LADAGDSEIDALPFAGAGSAGIPVIDLASDRGEVTEAISAACREWGMFLLVGHGIAHSRLRAYLDEAAHFFALPRDRKRRLTRTLECPWGYYDRELTKNLRDKKEIYDIGPEGEGEENPFCGSTPWPRELSRFSETMRTCMVELEHRAALLTEIIIAGLGVPSVAIAHAFRPSPTSFLRLNYYPTNDPLDDTCANDAGRAVHHHTDAGVLTVLIDDGVPGLQVLRHGCWHNVQTLPGALVVNIGDMLQVWSNGRYKAPVHRVLAMTKQERYSAPFFYNPAYGARIEPLPMLSGLTEPRYRAISWSDFRSLRAQGDYGNFGREVQIGDYAI